MSSDSDFGFDLDESALDELGQIEEAYATGKTLPPRSIVEKPGLKQRDLFGGYVAPPPPKPVAGPSRTKSVTVGGNGMMMGETQAKVKVVKKWDAASFAKHGWSKKGAAATKAKSKKAKGKGKGKAKDYGSDEEGWDEDMVLDDDSDNGSEDELLDQSYDPNAPILPIKWPPDAQAAKTWQYPVQADKPLRTYQYNIVHKALFDNTLVSLPTGLGKTFIAACVMLNFYRWYPQGKIIFLAPSRPLVAQQVTACHYIAGIPQDDCIELTGFTNSKLRAIGWATKRVIYSTPQTVENDLAKGRLDPRDVTCLVVDEAHRATGDYAYSGVVRYMMSRNPHFRVLALTATPGSRGEAVQEVIDNLHIGDIEVRTDQSFDIKQYIHKKSYDLLVLPLGPSLSSLRDKWSSLMQIYQRPLLAARLVFQADPVMLSPFTVNMGMQKVPSLPGGKQANAKYYPMLKTLGTMARAMEYLIIQSVTEFESGVKDLESNGPKALTNNPTFRDVVKECRELRMRQGYVGHPKMEKLRSMCIEHFVAAEEEKDPTTGLPRQTRVMVFCNYRAVVEEIVACLNQQRPLIKATPFVGQASSRGSRGMSQKDQIETIRQFKKGKFNVLVASSIGEEGLDIGEIDLIVCYEANKSPIRMLQRVGRTGRARDGHIIVLMSEGREEKNWDKAKEAYNDVQNALISNKTFELFADGDRMLPKTMKPEVDKVEIKALPLDLSTMTMAGQKGVDRLLAAAARKKEKKAPRDPKLNIPDDAFVGFRTAGQLEQAAKAIKAKLVSPGKKLRDRKAAVYLTEAQEEEMRSRWCFQGDRRVKPTIIDQSSLAIERGGASGSALRIPRHSTKHSSAFAVLKTIEQLDDSNSEGLDAWHDKMSNAFNPKLVKLFDRPTPDADDPPRKPRTSLKRVSPSSPDRALFGDSSFIGLPPATRAGFAATTQQPLFNPPTSSLPAPTRPTKRTRDDGSPPPAPRVVSRAPSSSPGIEIVEPPPKSTLPKKEAPSKVAKPSTVSSRAVKPSAPPPPPASANTRVKPPPSQTIYHKEQVGLQPRASLDPYNMLSSDDTPPPPHGPSRPAKSVPIQPPKASKASTSYSAMLDDDPMGDGDEWSESQFLKGAKVVTSRSRTASQKTTSKTEEKAPVEAIIIDSEDDTPPVPDPVAVVDSSPRFPSPPAPPRSPKRSPSLIPDSDGEMELGDGAFAFPAPSRGNTTDTLKDDDDDAIEIEEDEYSFFEVADEDLEACFAVQDPDKIVQAAPAPQRSSSLPPPPSAQPPVKMQPLEALGEPEQEEEVDDSVIMPPPPLRAASSAAKAPFRPAKTTSTKPTTAQPQYRPRPAHHRIPDSDSSSIARHPSSVAAVENDESSPVVVGHKRARLPLAVASSSSSPPIKGKFRFADDSPASVPKVLNRMRRGRQEAAEEEVMGDLSDSDDEVMVAAPVRKSKSKKEKEKERKTKRPKLDVKQAVKSKMFDVEAVNSSASGTEASSEDYATEDTDDRNFVARSNEVEDDEDAAAAQAAFYRESLMTQPPAGFGRAFGRRSLGMSGAARRVVHTPGTPVTQDDWSYDSFCVPDDEEPEYEDSSQQ